MSSLQLPQEIFDISSVLPSDFSDTDSSARNILSQEGVRKSIDYDGICMTYFTVQSGSFSGSGGWGSVNNEWSIDCQELIMATTYPVRLNKVALLF